MRAHCDPVAAPAGALPGLRRRADHPGSDAHRPEDVGKGIAQAQELLRTVGFRYFTVYHRRTPQFIRL